MLGISEEQQKGYVARAITEGDGGWRLVQRVSQGPENIWPRVHSRKEFGFLLIVVRG